MNIAQHIAKFTRRGQNDILNKELQQQASELESKAAQIKIMANSKGWEFVKEYLEKSSLLFKDTLIQTDPKDSSMIIRMQEAIKVRKEMIQFIDNFSSR